MMTMVYKLYSEERGERERGEGGGGGRERDQVRVHTDASVAKV